MSILSERRDGLGFYYGFAPNDARRIDVRVEEVVGADDKKDGTSVRLFKAISPAVRIPAWAYYVGGERRGYELSKGEAELSAIRYIKEHPNG